MLATCIGAVVVSKSVTLVECQPNADGSLTIIKDETFHLESGPRPAALRKMQQRLHDRLDERARKLVVKASSGGQFAARTALLQAAELRGVLLSAAPADVEVVEVHSKSVSREKPKKINEYLKDDDYFEKFFAGGALRKGSREAAFLLLREVEK